jgi:hypothetical protein
MMQLIITTRRKPLRHWRNALAIARPDQPRHVKRTHPPPRVCTENLIRIDCETNTALKRMLTTPHQPHNPIG